LIRTLCCSNIFIALVDDKSFVMTVFRETALLANSDITDCSRGQQISDVHGAANYLQQISTSSQDKKAT